MNILYGYYKETVEFHMQKALEAMNELAPGDWGFELDVEHQFLFAVKRDTQDGAITEGGDVAIIIKVQKKAPVSRVR